jgi:hypothetical protein
MAYKPFINLRPTTILKAFLLNAILTAVVTALTIETRRILDEEKYTKNLPDRPHKLIATILISITIGFIAYNVCRLLFGLGGGMIGPKNAPNTFYY